MTLPERFLAVFPNQFKKKGASGYSSARLLWQERLLDRKKREETTYFFSQQISKLIGCGSGCDPFISLFNQKMLFKFRITFRNFNESIIVSSQSDGDILILLVEQKVIVKKAILPVSRHPIKLRIPSTLPPRWHSVHMNLRIARRHLSIVSFLPHYFVDAFVDKIRFD